MAWHCKPAITCRDGKGDKLSNQAQKRYIIHRHTRNHSTNQIAGNSLFGSKIMLFRIIKWLLVSFNLIALAKERHEKIR